MSGAELWLLLAVTALAGLWSLSSGLASVFAWQAARLGERMPGQGAFAGDVKDLSLLRLLTRARALDPINPAYDEQLSQHLERLALQALPRRQVARDYLMQAHELNSAAAGRRPTWPLGLTSVLRTDFKLGRLDAQFSRLYLRAADLGRSEPAALRALVDLGLLSWSSLDPQGQRAVQDLLAHGLRLNPEQVLKRSLELGVSSPVEPLIAADADLQRLQQALRVRSARSE
jgi:hypothetical protein